MSDDNDYPITIHPEITSQERGRVELGIALSNVLKEHGEPCRIVLLKPDPVSDDEDGLTFDFLYGSMMPPGYKGKCRVKGNILLSVTVEDFPDFPSDNY